MTDVETPAAREPEAPEPPGRRCARSTKARAMIYKAAARFRQSKAVGRSRSVGRGLAKAGKALGRGLSRAGEAIARKRVLMPSCIAVGLGGSFAAILGLHSLLARAGSTDAWSAAIGAVATVVLVL